MNAPDYAAMWHGLRSWVEANPGAGLEDVADRMAYLEDWYTPPGTPIGGAR